MAGHSVSIDFWIRKEELKQLSGREKIVLCITSLLQKYCPALKKINDIELPGQNHMYIYASEKESLTIKIYKDGLVTSNLEYLVTKETLNKHKIYNDDGRQLEKDLVKELQCERAKVLPAIKRAPPINIFFSTSDDRLIEYDVDEIVFEEVSTFQKVQIYHTKSFGNMLVLDDLQNLAESDLSYTHALMNKGSEDFGGKEILILGGGDGALLWELLKEKPKFVTMIDIDETVLKACRKFMRSVCGDCLDNYDGNNYKIIINDAIRYMQDYVSEKRSFDYVIGDLTDIPISDSPRGQLWDFFRSILNLGVKLVRPGGKYMTHATGIQCENALSQFETQLNNLERPVTFTRTSSHVPSFMENWCFYQVTPKKT